LAALHFTDNNVIDVMRKAKELQLERAAAICALHCRDCVSVHNAVEWFVQACTHGWAFVPLASCGTTCEPSHA
jgi:hypothetical protein